MVVPSVHQLESVCVEFKYQGGRSDLDMIRGWVVTSGRCNARTDGNGDDEEKKGDSMEKNAMRRREDIDMNMW